MLFSIVTAPASIPTNSEGGFHFLYILSNICYLEIFLTMASLTGLKWYFTVVLICISLIIRDAEHLLCAYGPCVYLFFG